MAFVVVLDDAEPYTSCARAPWAWRWPLLSVSLLLVVLLCCACTGAFLPTATHYSAPLAKWLPCALSVPSPGLGRSAARSVPLPLFLQAPFGLKPQSHAEANNDSEELSQADGSEAPDSTSTSAPSQFPVGESDDVQGDDDPTEVKVLNELPEWAVAETLIIKQLELIRSIVGADGFGITLILTGDDEIRLQNWEFHTVDAPTDILSFPQRPAGLEPGQLPDDLPPPLRTLGDLFLSVPYVERQCARDEAAFRAGEAPDPPDPGVSGLMARGHFTVPERLPLLLIHGVLHLLGYDHETDSDYSVMAQKEMDVWQQFLQLAE